MTRWGGAVPGLLTEVCDSTGLLTMLQSVLLETIAEALVTGLYNTGAGWLYCEGLGTVARSPDTNCQPFLLADGPQAAAKGPK